MYYDIHKIWQSTICAKIEVKLLETLEHTFLLGAFPYNKVSTLRKQKSRVGWHLKGALILGPGQAKRCLVVEANLKCSANLDSHCLIDFAHTDCAESQKTVRSTKSPLV